MLKLSQNRAPAGIDNALKMMDYSTIRMENSGSNTRSLRKILASGFPGQRLVVVHPPQIAKASRMLLLQPFCPTDIGIFHSAAHHERRRPSGAPQTIFIRCVEGRGWCEMDGVRRTIRERELLVIPARCPHAYGAADKNPWTIEWFHAVGAGIPDYLRRLGADRRSPVLALRPGAWDSSLFEEALASLEAGFTDAHLLHAALALGHLLGRLIVVQKQSHEDRSSVSARLERTAAFLREHHARPLNVPELAAQAGFSTSHFANLFLKHTGHPPMEYLIRVRIGRACQLLDLTGLSVKEIAAQVGYTDPYYFSRVFKKVTACSPKGYRKAHKG